MGILSRGLEAKRKLIGRLAGARSFESYLRHGRVPEVYAQLVEATESERKFLDFCSPDHSHKALGGETRPTTHYTWRTAGDERVRSSHAANEGRIFAWADAPPIGHPGTEPNCRCWPEPYYGDPSVPDDRLLLRREVRPGRDDDELWSSVETVTRPDGSLAEALLVAPDGTRVHSTYAGDRLTHDVILADGRKVTVANANGLQTIYVGENRTPLLHSRWSPNGPIVKRPRVAFQDNNPGFWIGDQFEDDLLFEEILDPNPTDLFDPGSGGLGAALAMGLFAVYGAIQTLTDDDRVPVVVFKAWERDGRAGAIPVLVDLLERERVRQSCKVINEVQTWTNQAVAEERATGSQEPPWIFGTRVHKRIRDKVDLAKAEQSLLYGNLEAEYSIDPSGDNRHGRPDSTRLDILEKIPGEEPELICVYDIKTGNAQLDVKRLAEIAASVAIKFPGVDLFILEIKPTQ